MTALVLDATSLAAVDADDRAAVAHLRVAHALRFDLRTTGAALAEAWRPSPRVHGTLDLLLPAVKIAPVDEHIGRTAGWLQTQTGGPALSAATVVAVAEAGDCVLTTQPQVVKALVAASRRGILVIGFRSGKGAATS